MVSLYLFTTTFPFGSGESFLEQEVPYLAERFERVTIVPTRQMDPTQAARPLPDNVALDLSIVHDTHEVRAGERLPFKLRSAANEALGRPRTMASLQDLRRLWYYLRVATRARRWLDEAQPADDDRVVLYTYWLDGTTFGLATGRRPDTTLVSRVHSGDLYEEKHASGFLPLHRATISRLDRLFPVSDHGRRYLVDKWPDLAPRIAVERLGVPDPGHTTPASSDGTFRIVTCSHIKPVKRIPLMMEGIAAFSRRHPELKVSWRHLGPGAGLEALNQQVRETFPANAEGAFLGRLPIGGIIDHYRTHPVDVFLNASSAEGVPVSIMEAQSCGIPVVATTVGGTPEIVNDDNGFRLHEDPTPDEIAEALRVVREDDGARRMASKETWRARSRAEAVYPAFAETIRNLRPRS